MPSINDLLSRINSSSGLARQNKYQVTIPTATLLANSDDIYNKLQQLGEGSTDTVNWMRDYLDTDIQDMGLRLSAFCDKTEIPGIQLQTDTVGGVYGPSFKFPHRVEYSDITMTFLCGADMAERYFFDAWMYLISDPTTNDFNYTAEYVVDIDIAQYNDFTSVQTQTFNVESGLVSEDGSRTPGTGTDQGTTQSIVLEANYVTTLIDAYPIAVSNQELGYDTNGSVQKVQVTFTYKYAVPFTGKESTTDTARRGDPALFSAYQTNNPSKLQQNRITITDNVVPGKR
jgi:hypothetical protein